jgi:hypothetical protein
MIKIDGIVFDDYKVQSVEMDLTSCITTLKVQFRRDNKRITKQKEYTFLTDCDVNVNKLIEELKQIVNE